MKIGHLDCFCGTSGDMFLGALVDAGVPLEAIREALATLPLGGYSISADRVHRAGIAATQVQVRLDEGAEQPARGLADVLAIIEAGSLPPSVTERSGAVFRALADAEARVHGTDVQSVHFHEVGAVDAICDIVGAVVGIAALGLEELTFSTVMLGSGTVRSEHSVLPVPAPATAELLKGLPTAGGPVEAELTTPTGAAILKTLGRASPSWPSMRATSIGHGAGARDFEAIPNVLRLSVGETGPVGATQSDCVWVLAANLDDMTGEELGHCTERLFAAGALDTFTAPVQMKKSRPGVQLTVLCAPERLGAVEAALWRHSSTLGIRRSLWQRSKLRRESRTATTPWGEVRIKVAWLGDEMVRCEPEYEDCRAIADAHGLSLRQVCRAALSGARRE